MLTKRVTVLRGGPSEEYDISMRTGSSVLKALSSKVAKLSDVVISKKGEWLENGKVKSPEQILRGADVVFLALHGAYGEDGEIQKYLQRFNVPFTGSRSFPSAVAFNKETTKHYLSGLDINLPQHKVVRESQSEVVHDIVKDIQLTFGPEYIIKPVSSGSSLGVTLIHQGQSLEVALRESLLKNETVMVEEYIRGREATCAVLENFRNEPVYVFPVVEIIPPRDVDFFTAEVKYTGETKKICPANFTYNERDILQKLATEIHTVLGLSQYSRSDFILRDGKAYFLEVNTLPGLTSQSLYPKAAEAVGLAFDDLVKFLVETATP